MKNLIVCTLLSLLSLPAAAQETQSLTPSGDPAPMRAVKLITPGQSAVPNERVFFGQIVAKETVDISFEVGGQMVMFDAQEGQFMEAGTTLAALDRDPFERAVKRAQLRLSQAERDFVRTKTLVQSNAIAETQADDAQFTRDLAEVALQEAEDALDNATMVAPFRALVASRLTPNFANVAPGQPIVRLHDMSEVRVEIDVPERLFQQRSGAAGVTFTGSSPLFESDIPLEMREFNAETQNIGQSYQVTFALPDNKATAAIIPGASMTVTARQSPTQSGMVVLPPAAVTTQYGQTKVMVYTPDASGDTGTVDWQTVQVGSATGTDITVTGLDPKVMIVGAGAHLLRAGETVRPYAGLSVE